VLHIVLIRVSFKQTKMEYINTDKTVSLPQGVPKTPLKHTNSHPKSQKIINQYPNKKKGSTTTSESHRQN